ncbi:MAG: Ig-like domain-containing protein [Solirubrobacteraceae bacterium]
MGKRCKLVVKVATLRFAGVSGRNIFKFKPSLRPGTYTATLTAVDSAGRTSRPFSFTFKIKKVKKHK